MQKRRAITSAQSDPGTCRVLPDGRAARRRKEGPREKSAGFLLFRPSVDAPAEWRPAHEVITWHLVREGLQAAINQLREADMAKKSGKKGGGKGRGCK